VVVDNQDSGEEEMPTLPFPAQPDTAIALQPEPEAITDNTPSNQEKAEEHYLNGVFFYDAGNLSKAIDEWELCIELDPDNENARNRLLKAEAEIEEAIDRHYQNALLHKKYMRFSEAIEEFTIVSEMSRDKDDERYVNSLKEIKELEGR
jgi:tetratricopeptide (TPR) repeat protein